MKTHLDIKHEGTLGTEGRVKMSFDENSVTHLMSVLTDLYSDPALAVIREYSTNAYDSHRAAGKTAPIEVWLPNGMNPIFIVKDEGVGMTVDDVCNHFSKYGWSSKRDTDNEVGMLGLGCKSGLTYASQFTFVAIHNGVKATVLVTRDDDGAGAIQIVDTVSTDEPNGVEVRVPVKDVFSFCQKARHFYSFWEKGTVRIDGTEPASIFDDITGLVLEPDLVLLRESSLKKDYIVMGNVPYPLDYSTRLVENYNMHAVARVPIGAVNFTPSREALHFTSRTKKVVYDIAAKVRDLTIKVAQAEMDACKTHREAIQCAQRWRPMVPRREDLKFKGEAVPSYFTLQVTEGNSLGLAKSRKAFCWMTRLGHDQPATAIATIEADRAFDHIFVVGHPGPGVTGNTKLRLKKYLEEKSLNCPKALFVYKMPDGDWLSEVERVEYGELRKIPVGEAKPRERNKETVRTIGPHGYVLDTKRDALTTPLVYLRAIERTANSTLQDTSQRIGTIMAQVGGTCVLLNENQVAKFTREYPHAVPFKEWLQLHVKSFLASLKPEEAYYMSRGSMPIAAFRIDPKLILDPEYRSVVERIKNMDLSSKNHQWSHLLRLCREMFIGDVKNPNDKTFAAEVAELLARYPLIDWSGYGYKAPEAYLEYINSVYTVRQQKK